VAVLRIPDPNEPPFPYNMPVSDNEDVKTLILLVGGLQKQIKLLEKRIRYLENERNHHKDSKRGNGQ
tara:strand:- start:136 stop:336 length:201 start_codon:yes stop_codon:yes gene_type:complete